MGSLWVVKANLVDIMIITIHEQDLEREYVLDVDKPVEYKMRSEGSLQGRGQNLKGGLSPSLSKSINLQSS